jgi:biotin carboxylase
MYPGTISFQRFEYPSSLPQRAQRRMRSIAKTYMTGIGFDNGFFNIEYMYNSHTKKIHIIEVNPRCSAQFADFYEKVDGTNSYDIMLALATGQALPPYKKRNGEYGIAASCALRTFNDYIVKRAPSSDDINRVKQQCPDTFVQIHGDVGEPLSAQLQDGKSYLYAIINMGGKNKADLLQRFEACNAMLPFDFSPLPT